MTYAIIDIGTNSVRYMLADCNEEIKELYSDRVITRLGKGLYDGNNLMCRESITATANAVAAFAEHARQNNADKIICVATSAVRDAENSAQLAELIKSKAGIGLNVLSGEHEALAGFVGAMGNVTDKDNTILVDIGGGSTEIIQRLPNGEVSGISYNCGCVRLFELFDENYSDALDFVKNTITVPAGKKIILIGGTACVLAMLARGVTQYNRDTLHLTAISYEYIVSLRDKLTQMTQLQREELIAFDKKRADIIPYGLIIISYIMEQAGAAYITSSEEGLMHGVIRLDIDEALKFY